eukprot:1155926-Pelagomonas_calceolata.AAC.6
MADIAKEHQPLGLMPWLIKHPTGLRSKKHPSTATSSEWDISILQVLLASQTIGAYARICGSRLGCLDRMG